MEVLQERRKGKPNYPNRKEVVALATTRSSHSDPSTEDTTDERSEATKVPLHKRALAAAGTPLWVIAVVAIVAVVEYFVLLGTSMSVGKFGKLSFPSTLSFWLFIFSLVYSVPVVIMLALRRTHRFASAPLRLLLLAVPLVLTLPLPAPLQSIYAWLLRNVLASTGVTLVNLFWGILGIVAIALHALFVVMLCRYADDDGSLVDSQQELDDLRNEEQADARRLSDKDQLVRSRKEHLDQATSEVEAADEAVNQASERRKKAQKAYDKLPLHQELSRLEAERQSKSEEHDSLKQIIAAHRATLDDPKLKLDTLDRKEREIKLKKAEARRKELFPYLFSEEGEENPYYLDDKIESLKEDIKRSDEKHKLDEAITAHTNATTTQDEAAKAAKKSDDKYKKAVQERNEEADIVKGHKDRANQLTSDIDETHKADRNLWRDVVFLPALTIAGALLLYSAWYGYVLVHVR